MAMENSGSKSSSGAADSYVGSLISLISKSEIRYEGILYNINAEESSIGLRNVRSFGTEGRKKDGPQVLPNDKVYEYILFRGSDIMDLQVKSSPPVQPTAPINNDPAIIQSHYPRPSLSASNGLPSSVNGSISDLGSHSAQVGLHGSGLQSGPPLYQPGGSLGSWGASPPPPNANPSGLAMPMYWQGYYGVPPNGLPLLHQQPLLRPSHGLSMSPSLQQPMQYPSFSAPLPTGTSSLSGSSFPEAPSSLLSLGTSAQGLGSSSLPASTLISSLPSTLPSMPSASLAPETFPSTLPNKSSVTTPPSFTSNTSLPLLSLANTSSADLSKILPPISNMSSVISGPISPPQSSTPSAVSIVGALNAIGSDQPKPSLVTPGQLLQSGPAAVSLPQPVQVSDKDVEVVQVLSSAVPEKVVPVTTEAQPPILPLPVPPWTTDKQNGGLQTHNGYRGRGRGRGRGAGRSYQVTKFAEDFDFTAMNEKFNKDEVWGHLGKSKDEVGFWDEDNAGLSKPVYNKDDFFDSLSSNTIDRESPNGRPRFSEQRKIDTETFGEFSRYRGGRGGRGYPRGGVRRGGYHGGGSYGYGGRGRGRGIPNRTS